VKSSALIELQIFNLKGQIVKSFPQFSVESGTHFFHWDGRDTSGLPAGSGVYLIVVKTPTHNIRRKLVKL
jgi:flagellar hook assembly protein FlgD